MYDEGVAVTANRATATWFQFGPGKARGAAVEPVSPRVQVPPGPPPSPFHKGRVSPPLVRARLGSKPWQAFAFSLVPNRYAMKTLHLMQDAYSVPPNFVTRAATLP